MMKYFKINLTLEEKIKQDLILFAKSNKDQYYKHLSTKSNTYTNLNFLFTHHPLYDIISKMVPVKGDNVCLLHIDKHKVITPHTDGKHLKRDTVVIFPLWPSKDNYSRCIVEGEEIPYNSCYAFNTQRIHWIENNNYERISLQIFYNTQIEDLYEQFRQFDGLV